jgi:HD-GYP domain-containing protein (c-di-GMP phosphodiesterase class II)
MSFTPDNPQRILDELSDKLLQAYEESSLAYELSGVATRGGDPRALVRDVCSRLHAVLPFEWLAIRFAHGTAVEALADELLLEGPSPLAPGAMKLAVDEFLDHRDWSAEPGPCDAPAFAAAPARIFASLVSHDKQAVGAIVTGPKCGADSDLTSHEIRLVRLAAGFLGQIYANAARLAEQQAMLTGTLKALAAAIDAKDPYTFGHSERVAYLARAMGHTMGLSPQQVEQYHMAGLLHDIGKIGVSEAVLCKPGRLTEEEFGQIRLHPGIGHRILRGIPALGQVLDGVMHHHEQWCGAGYPAGLGGREIPLIARVLALADAFDAMSSTRAYRCALSRNTVLGEICKCSGRQFDPDLAAIFLTLDFTGFDGLLARQLNTRGQAA